MAGVASPSTQKLNFQSAMQDFVTMFPHLDTNLIERVLRSNNGMVDQTIDHLLAISCDDPDVSGAFIDAHQPPPQNRQPVAQRNQSPSGAFSSAATDPVPPSYTGYAATPYPAIPYPATPQQSVPYATPAYPPRPQSNYPTLSSYLPPGDLTLTPREAQPSIQKYGQVPVDVMGVQFHVPYTAPLPNAFLRLSRPIQQQGSPMEGQLSEDREFALFLHNEELLHQARNNSEFMRTLQQAERATHVDPATGLPPDLPVCSTPSTSDGASEGNTSISERLAVTGKATRSKLLKIAKRLHLAKRSNTLILKKQSSVGKSTQRLINEDEDDEDRFLYNEEGGDLEEEEEEFAEMKTIPRQNTIDGYEQASRDACDVRIRSSKNSAPERPYRPPPSEPYRAPPPDPHRAPPPRPASVTPEPPPLSTLKRVSGIDFDDFAASRNTGSSTLTAPKVPSTLPPDLLYDPAYDDVEGPEYFTAEDILRRPTDVRVSNVSNLQPISSVRVSNVSNLQPISSDGQSVYSPSDGMSVCSFSTIGTNEFDTMGASGVSRKIHSGTLNSSYIIPIEPVSLQADETVYDNLPNDNSRNTKTENLINFD